MNAVDEVGALRTKAGRPYTVFSPFHRSWEQAGCVIGIHYPGPIVDHAEARREALERYRVG